MTATSPNIIDGDSPHNAATLCTVAGKVEDYNGLQTHFGRFLQAFFPDAPDALYTLVNLRQWLTTPAAPGALRVPVSRLFPTRVQVCPPPPKEETQSTRKRKSRAVEPRPRVSRSSAPRATGCWCSPLSAEVIGALPDEMIQHDPTTTARTSRLPPPPSPRMIHCSECNRAFHWFCVRDSTPRQFATEDWQCASCTASKAVLEPGVNLDVSAEVLSAVMGSDVAKCDQLNTAWSRHCEHCKSTPSPPPPVKLQASDTWQMCFTLSVDMLCEWAIKGMQKSPSMTHSCTSCYMPTSELQAPDSTSGPQASDSEATEYAPRTWHSMVRDAEVTAGRRGKNAMHNNQAHKPLLFWEPAQSVPSPLHVLIGLGNTFLERIQVLARNA